MTPKVVLLSVLAVLCFGIGALLDKFSVKNLPPTEAFLTRYYFLFAAMIPFLVLGWERNRSAMLEAPRWASFVLFGAVGITTLGMFLYYHALSQAEASRVVPFCSVYPLAAFFLAGCILGEPFTWLKLLGTLLVIGGTICLVR